MFKFNETLSLASMPVHRYRQYCTAKVLLSTSTRRAHLGLLNCICSISGPLADGTHLGYHSLHGALEA